jgi:hypothetical protein
MLHAENLTACLNISENATGKNTELLGRSLNRDRKGAAVGG